jgi:hypothetical protein
MLTDAAVLHVEDDEVGARAGENRRQSWREKLEGHGAEGGAARKQRRAHWIGPHKRIHGFSLFVPM